MPFLWSGRSPPRYLTVVVLFLIQAAWTLLWLVFRERRPAAG
jgi:hypothetical protein